MTQQANQSETTMAVAAVGTVLALAVIARVASPEKAGGFVVTGHVYCNLCCAGFETHVSKSMAGATVEVVCRHFAAPESKGTLKAEATMDNNRWYKLEIDQDHQEEICEVVLATKLQFVNGLA